MQALVTFVAWGLPHRPCSGIEPASEARAEPGWWPMKGALHPSRSLTPAIAGSSNPMHCYRSLLVSLIGRQGICAFPCDRT